MFTLGLLGAIHGCISARFIMCCCCCDHNAMCVFLPSQVAGLPLSLQFCILTIAPRPRVSY